MRGNRLSVDLLSASRKKKIRFLGRRRVKSRHVSLRAAHNALGLRSSHREELSQDQLIKIAQLFDASTSDRVATRLTRNQGSVEVRKSEVAFGKSTPSI
ncbi:hypothetical protein E1B28_013718 [Marasmius oreades]|uniref:Uncharacterized protein n=1 Tax=Marasmius oreades TaxID=181124 RepID=A0A9P7RQ70_9AGAR|nr:uncharacterized protein E1B28_013718 [Marasmius oreades]KAG7087776.1 hypothetical protein E1B28_013718 [Marasmius oreades]